MGVLRVAQSAWESFGPAIALRNRRAYRRQRNAPFEFVGLMLSRECGARCLFCPVRPGATTARQLQHMPLAVAESVIDQLAGRSFTGEVNLAENGDALLNPEFGRIIAMAHEKLPDASLVMYSNMMHLTPEIADMLLRHNLRCLTVNIDGATARTYKVSKPGLDFERVTGNLRQFIRLRDERRSKCTVHISVIAPRRFLDLRRDGQNPAIPYDAPEVVAQWQPLLGSGDSIDEPVWLYAWSRGSRHRRHTPCPPLIVDELLSKLFVSTEGDAYCCCLDHRTAMTYGSVLDGALHALWESDRRHELVENIIQQRFGPAGRPCSHCAERYDYLACELNLASHRAAPRPGTARGEQQGGTR